MAAELNAHGNAMGGLSKTVVEHKLKPSKKQAQDLKTVKSAAWGATKKALGLQKQPDPKEASANDVRRALGEGNISPAEATGLNPLGGLIPNSRDVRDAYKEGHISREEAFGLKPTVDINNLGGRGSRSSSSASSSTGASSNSKPNNPGSARASSNSKPGASGEPIRVRSERVTKPTTAITGPRAIEAPKYVADPKGPSAIGAPGPTASESAAVRAQSAAKGTRNTSSIKVAEPSVDLEDGPNFGRPVYSITDVPRQWNRNA